jgi:predicted HD phosphohydrolase
VRVTPAVDEVVEEIVDACRSMAGLPYDGEPVDQLEHALQCAALARERHEDTEFVIACLLHDIARAPAVAGIPYDGAGEHHGLAGARWLEPRVGARVAWLAEQHVPAKRYLVATDPGYRARLTVVSERTLREQGGPMTPAEVEAFRANPDWGLAVALREIDDRGKVPGAVVPGLDAYRDELRTAVADTAGILGDARSHPPRCAR